ARPGASAWPARRTNRHKDQRMTDAPLYPAGHRFEWPDGQVYELLNDVIAGRPIMACEFKPLNGAPQPRTGHEMPVWLAQQLRAG
ncbi:MAG: hypothetical protein J0H31_00120, partial [Alphaproteobacteria bacterium]|nr:hypothetical protein [Alphaproteobacteria bacterium]